MNTDILLSSCEIDIPEVNYIISFIDMIVIKSPLSMPEQQPKPGVENVLIASLVTRDKQLSHSIFTRY